MFNASSSRLRLFAFTAVLVACSPPSASAPLVATLTDDALVIEARTDEDAEMLSASIRIATAPPGEYLLFSTPERPTSLAGVDDLDQESCKPFTCSVPGLGLLNAWTKLDAPGPISLLGSDGDGKPKNLFFVLVRRGAATKDALAVRGDVTVETAGGCDNPDPPSVSTTSLAGAAAMAPPSCEELKTQIDGCTTISQSTKDKFGAWCAGVSADCRKCLDGVLCGVTEQCDPACGKE